MPNPGQNRATARLTFSRRDSLLTIPARATKQRAGWERPHDVRRETEHSHRVPRHGLRRRHRARHDLAVYQARRRRSLPFFPLWEWGAAGLPQILRPCIPLPRRGDQLLLRRLDARPVVARAPETPERAGLDVEPAGALQRHRRVIGVAAGAAVDAAGPGVVRFRLHVDEHALAPAQSLGQRVAAQCGPAALDADCALGTDTLPFAERRIGLLVVVALCSRCSERAAAPCAADRA